MHKLHFQHTIELFFGFLAMTRFTIQCLGEGTCRDRLKGGRGWTREDMEGLDDDLEQVVEGMEEKIERVKEGVEEEREG